MNIAPRYFDYMALALIFIFGALYLLVSINAPIVFGDEGYYGTAARWMAKNLIIPEFFPHFETEIYHERFSVSKPLFFLYETFGYFFGGETLVKILIVLPAVVGALLVYIIGKKYFGPPAGLAASVFFLLTPSLVTYGVLGYVDALFVMLVLAALYFGLLAFEKGDKRSLLTAGVFTGLAVLTKNSALFLLLFFFLYEIFIDGMKNKKYFIAIILISIIVVAPWLLRNQILFESPCYWKIYSDELCGPKFDTEVPKISELKFEGRTEEAGTEVSFFKFGFLHYTRFAYGWALPFLFFLGLALAIERKGLYDKIFLLLLLSALPLFAFSTWRTEDTARYMLPLNIPMVLISGAFVGALFSAVEKKHILIGVVVLMLFVGFAWVYGNEKLTTMVPVKHFISGAIIDGCNHGELNLFKCLDNIKQFKHGVFDACDWVKKNTPEDSVLFATYGSQIRYQCERRLALARDAEEVMLGNENISYEHLKLNGINYVFVINGLITPQKLQENYPESFVKMMENSTMFKKVFDNGDRFGHASVRIFEVI